MRETDEIEIPTWEIDRREALVEWRIARERNRVLPFHITKVRETLSAALSEGGLRASMEDFRQYQVFFGDHPDEREHVPQVLDSPIPWDDPRGVAA